jgi:sterol desaturase/sphingolipid hydroxylase (fatty acid hydroxylase superfamily)
MPLWILMVAILGSSGLILTTAQLAFKARISAGARIHEQPPGRNQGWAMTRSAIVNGAISSALFFAITIGLYDHLFFAHPTSIGWEIAKGVGIIVLYDFLYYGMHRFLFHETKLLRRVHSVHHQGQYPTALDALFLHPVETILGVGLILSCTWVFGPIHAYTFAVIFFFYTHLNILIHCGLDFRIFPLNVLGFLARKHDRHHDNMRAGNYASITPLPDLIFGTLQ